MNCGMPKISIVVPIYNSAHYLEKCLNSLINQSYRNIEIICVNDGSTDKSGTIIDQYSTKDKRVIVIHKKNEGVSVARNTGLDRVSGQFFMFVDSDDWLDLDCCKKMLETALKHSADVVMCSYMKEFTDHQVKVNVFSKDFILTGQRVQEKIHRRLFGPVGKELNAPQNMDIIVSPWMQLFNTSRFGQIYFPDIKETGTFEDGLYQIDIYRNCQKFVYMNCPYYHYRKTNALSITSNYKPYLLNKWKELFRILDFKIVSYHYNSKNNNKYEEALSNRICISIIGLGLNQIYSGKSFRKNAKEIRIILNDPLFKKSFRSLKTNYFPVHWKIFFSLCKHNQSYLVVLMLYGIEFLRKNIR